MFPFELDASAEQSLAFLTTQQRAQLTAAMTYHALINSSSELEFIVSIGSPQQMPALTDRTTTGNEPLGDEVARVRVTSKARGSAGDSGLVTRRIRLGHAAATPATTEPPETPSLPHRLYRFLEIRSPLLLDAAREFVMKRRSRATFEPLPRFPYGKRESGILDEMTQLSAFSRPAPGSQPAVLFGLHWLQTGGAERWAIESIRIARDSGLRPIIVTDKNSVHPWITRPELDGCMVITMSYSDHQHPLDLPLAQALLNNFDIRGIVLHHSQWLYDSLPWIKAQRPDVPVIDSLHIVEYLRGGYPGSSVHFDDYIDLHHVISPQLVEWMSQVQGVDARKLVLAPLGALTVNESQQFKARDPHRPFTVAFIGRLSRQKRPDLFIALVHRLRKQGLRFHAILQGDGELRNVVQRLIDRFGLEDVIEQRFEDTPVSQTLAGTDLLVISSINEGLTLTTFEAVAAGVPVISTDVGSQYTLVDGEMLLPRAARKFLPAAVKRITMLSTDEAQRESAWREQRRRAQDFAANPDARTYFERLFAQWQE